MNSKNKISAASAATLLLASASSFAADELVEYFPDGDLEGLTGFDNSGGWSQGNLVYDAPTGIFLFRTALDADGNKIPVSAYGQIGKGWSRYIDNTRNVEAGKPKQSEHAPAGNDTNVQFQNHVRSAHSDGLYREVEGVQAGVTYNLKGDGATKGSLQWALAYSKVGAPVSDSGISEVTLVPLTNTMLSDNLWVTLEDSFTAPDDTDITQPFKVYLRTADQAPTNIAKTEYARMWVDNFSLMGPEIPDADEDGVSDLYDKFPTNAAAAFDNDDDGMPDGFLDTCDQACIDGSGLTLDTDDDNDTVVDIDDAYPLDASKSISVDVGPGFPMFVANTTVTLDASESVPNSDVEGVTYNWLQLLGTQVTLSPDGQTVSFTAPDVAVREEAEFELSIEGAIDTKFATYPLSIVPTPAEVTANATITGMADTAGNSVVAGDVIVLDASASTDSEGLPLTYLWEQVGGRWDQKVTLENADSAVASFTVPEWNDDLPIEFKVTVSNGVKWPNVDPTSDESGGLFETSVDTVTINATLIKQESEKPDGGSIGFIGMILLGGLSLVRRLVKVKK
jgi:hypothetical protein